jgi:hypothetical protein
MIDEAAAGASGDAGEAVLADAAPAIQNIRVAARAARFNGLKIITKLE